MPEKIWKIPQITKDTDQGGRSTRQILEELLKRRGLSDNESARSFLEASYEKDAFDPFLFKDMEAAISLLISHIKASDRICVYGDYDADGVTSSVLLVELLRLLRADVIYYIPDRVTEGYGLNPKALERICSDGAKLIISVDTGIRNKAEVAWLKEQGIEVIITDHHVGPEQESDYPDCLIIDPALPHENIPFRRLAGVGVALKFIEALLQRSKLDEKMRLMIRESLFDLAAIGTIADCVSLLGENRLIVKKGLENMRHTKRIGLRELMEVAKLKPENGIDSWNIGFQIAPRINAAGRMDHANTAFALLLTRDANEAKGLAAELDHNNRMRQRNTESILEEVEAQLNDPQEYLLAAFYEYKEGEEHEPWNEGIIGLVSGKVTEKYYRPSIIMTRTENGFKGSGRSIPDFDIAQALEACKEHLSKYGGHPLACGFSLEADKLGAFISAMKQYADTKLSGLDLRPFIEIDASLAPEEISCQLVEELATLKPYGQDNPQPIFLSEKLLVIDKSVIGADSRHLRLRLKGEKSSLIPAIGFGLAERCQDLQSGDLIDVVYNLDINEFNGRRDAQLKIIDLRYGKQ